MCGWWLQSPTATNDFYTPFTTGAVNQCQTQEHTINTHTFYSGCLLDKFPIVAYFEAPLLKALPWFPHRQSKHDDAGTSTWISGTKVSLFWYLHCQTVSLVFLLLETLAPYCRASNLDLLLQKIVLQSIHLLLHLLLFKAPIVRLRFMVVHQFVLSSPMRCHAGQGCWNQDCGLIASRSATEVL